VGKKGARRVKSQGKGQIQQNPLAKKPRGKNLKSLEVCEPLWGGGGRPTHVNIFSPGEDKKSRNGKLTIPVANGGICFRRTTAMVKNNGKDSCAQGDVCGYRGLKCWHENQASKLERC